MVVRFTGGYFVHSKLNLELFLVIVYISCLVLNEVVCILRTTCRLLFLQLYQSSL